MPSSKVGLTFSSISTVFSTPFTSTLPPVKVGVPFCVCPLGPSDSSSVEVGLTGITVGVYVAVAVAVISVSLASFPNFAVSETVTGVAVPVNVFNGTKVTSPVSLSIE